LTKETRAAANSLRKFSAEKHERLQRNNPLENNDFSLSFERALKQEQFAFELCEQCLSKPEPGSFGLREQKLLD
jgi:hypothetical protein